MCVERKPFLNKSKATQDEELVSTKGKYFEKLLERLGNLSGTIKELHDFLVQVPIKLLVWNGLFYKKVVQQSALLTPDFFEEADALPSMMDYLLKLIKTGLGGIFLKLVEGLLKEASSKVHVNIRFTEEIPLTRGVRQGCPLSPLLFTLTMQPLMDYCQQKLDSRELQGV